MDKTLAQQRAREYSRQVAKKRKQEKIRTAALVTFFIPFFIISCGITGNNVLESEGIVVAKEIETEAPELCIEGTVWHHGFVETEDGMLRPTGTDLPDGTEVIVYYKDNGTVHPNDDYDYRIIKR